MDWILGCVCVALLLVLVELWVLHRRVNELPLATWSVVKDMRAEDQAKALDALEEAAASKVPALVAEIRSYHDELEASLRGHAANAEMRARVIERRSLEVGVALGEASRLLSQLRAIVDGASARREPQPAQIAAGLGPRPARKTLLGIRPPAPPLPVADVDDGMTDEELTQVLERVMSSPKSKKGGVK